MFRLSPGMTGVDARRDAARGPGDDACSGAPPHRATAASASPLPGSTLSAGAHQRESRCCSSSIAKRTADEEFEGINRDHMEAFKDSITAYGWFYPVVEFLGMLALALLLAYGGFRVRAGRADPGRGGRLLPVRPALFPADPGPERKVQHPAGRDGCFRAHLQAAGYTPVD